jgi:hypothetical protein
MGGGDMRVDNAAGSSLELSQLPEWSWLASTSHSLTDELKFGREEQTP